MEKPLGPRARAPAGPTKPEIVTTPLVAVALVIFTVEIPGPMSTWAELAGVLWPCASRAVTMHTTS